MLDKLKNLCHKLVARWFEVVLNMADMWDNTVPVLPHYKVQWHSLVWGLLTSLFALSRWGWQVEQLSLHKRLITRALLVKYVGHSLIRTFLLMLYNKQLSVCHQLRLQLVYWGKLNVTTRHRSLLWLLHLCPFFCALISFNIFSAGANSSDWSLHPPGDVGKKIHDAGKKFTFIKPFPSSRLRSCLPHFTSSKCHCSVWVLLFTG